MPYEYRKLTPEERQEIVLYRVAQKYPLHAPPHPFRFEGAYLLTAVNYEHKPIMHSPRRRTEFETRLLAAMKEIAKEVIAWVVLANHYHVLVNIESLDDVSAVLKSLHGTTSHEWNKEDGLTGKRRVWYKFFDTYIRNDSHLHTAFNYIHYNPVKHGYVTDAYEWDWSSLPLYYSHNGGEWLRENWRKHKPSADFGKGWDDDTVPP